MNQIARMSCLGVAALIATNISAEPPVVKTRETAAIDFQQTRIHTVAFTLIADGAEQLLTPLEPGRLHAYDFILDTNGNAGCVAFLNFRKTENGVDTEYPIAVVANESATPLKISHDLSIPIGVRFDPAAGELVRFVVRMRVVSGTNPCRVSYFSALYEAME